MIVNTASASRRLASRSGPLKARRVRDVRKQSREYYFDHRPTWDVEQQCDGNTDDDTSMGDVDDDDDDDMSEDHRDFAQEPEINLNIPERAELARLACKQPEDLSDEELMERRIQFGEGIVALMSKRETVRRDIIVQREADERMKEAKDESMKPSRNSIVDMSATPAAAPVHLINTTTKPTVDNAALPDDPFPCRMDKSQCPCCIGDERLAYTASEPSATLARQAETSISIGSTCHT